MIMHCPYDDGEVILYMQSDERKKQRKMIKTGDI